MSTYAFSPDSRCLIVSWETGHARRAWTVMTVPQGHDAAAVDGLAAALDSLAGAMWATYVHPAAQFGDPREPNSEAWLWAGEREAFPAALAAVRCPILPEGGVLTMSYCRVEEGGHRVGRAIRALGLGGDLVSVIEAEVAAEQAAIEAAEAGDLSGRAAQAVALSRIGVSPTQLHVAWTALLADPLGCHEALLTEFEPSAAAVAVTACLRSAAEITAEVSGVDWTQVVVESDNIDALPVRTPTAILDLLDQGVTEREAVTQLLAEADSLSEGRLNSVGQLVVLVEQMQRLQRGGVSEKDLDLRLTPLDPRRAARDLLEDLLAAIDGCFTLWREYQELPVLDIDDLADDEDIEDAEERILSERLLVEFSDLLRAAMETVGAPSVDGHAG